PAAPRNRRTGLQHRGTQHGRTGRLVSAGLEVLPRRRGQTWKACATFRTQMSSGIEWRADGSTGMRPFRIALANLQFPATPDESVRLAEQAIADAAHERADLVCFPECFVPGYRAPGKRIPPPDPAFLERAWSSVAAAAGKADVAVVLGTERV